MMEDFEKIKKILDNHEIRLKKLEGRTKSVKNTKNKKASSIMDYIMEMKDDSFFKNPKLLKDIINELGRSGHHYNASSLTEPLQRAVRQKKLGRVGQKGKWQYVSR
jgi:hypothetical protein